MQPHQPECSWSLQLGGLFCWCCHPHNQVVDCSPISHSVTGNFAGAATLFHSKRREVSSFKKKMFPIPAQALLRADDWFYKGEGAANLVLGYQGGGDEDGDGSSPSSYLAGKVLRIQKVPKGSHVTTNERDEFLSQTERLLWGETEDVVESASKEIEQQVFVERVMAPLLGSQYIDAGIRISVAREFLESVEKNINDQRPAWRLDTSKVDTLCDSALLISDHSVFSSGTLKKTISFAVEIKPKCGFLPSSEFIAKRNAAKKCVTRFKMHQLLKLKQGEISRISDYDPLDFFSGSKDKIYQAIMALFATPQNNLRIFLNGALIFGGLGGVMDDTTVQSDGSREKIEDLIKVTGLSFDGFSELITEAIFKSGILDPLKAAQQLDALDIEGAIHTFYNIISQPCMVCRRIEDAELQQKYSFLHSLSLEESLKIVREYLIATTAKDCSLMICFRPKQGVDSMLEYNSAMLKSSNQSFDYKAYFIDLDRKPLRKMVYYYELDQKIVSMYTESEKIKRDAMTGHVQQQHGEILA